jgi:hypothetical protein
MKKHVKLFLVLLLTAGLPGLAQNKVVYSWNFNQPDSSLQISGKGSTVPGVVGNGYKFDGFTSAIDDTGHGNIRMPKAFTLSAWIAMGAYPWNWAPIVTIGKYKITGFYFGIDSRGCLGFYLSEAKSVWHGCQSPPDEKTGLGMDLHRWYHVAATYDPKEGIKIYINGKLQGTYNDSDFDRGVIYSELEKGFRIGMNREDLAPTDPVRDWATWPSMYSFDGIMDEIRIHDGAMPAGQISQMFTPVKPANEPAFDPRKFPVIPRSGRFGANYTRLEYYPEWDNLWPPGDQLDVAVQFDQLPIRVMFWRGSRYSPCWVSENNKWMADQSRETGYNWYLEEGDRDLLPTGCLEHMSDVQCRSSRVAIIENNDARVVVNWRYLQMDVKFKQKDLPDNSQFGEWGNELYYIYPDGVGIRHVLPGRGGWMETIFFSEPGTRPEDNVELEVCTLVNMDGASKTYTWEHGYPKFDLQNANIQLVNFKSEYKPFLILQEGGGFQVFNGEIRPDYSHFPWWNHWPVAQIHSDGRGAIAPDRAAHSSLSWGLRYGDAAMYGMTNQPKEHLVKLARSWNYPPELRIASEQFKFDRYDRIQRAYSLECQSGGNSLGFTLQGSEKEPVLNPVFVVKNWDRGDLKLKVDGQPVPRGPDFRYGREYGIDGKAKLVIFVKVEADRATRFEFEAGSN